MAYSLELPNGSVVEGIPDDVPRFQALARLRSEYPQAFAQRQRRSMDDILNAAYAGYTPPPPPAPPKRTGVAASFGKGVETALSGLQTLGESVVGDSKTAAEAGIERSRKIGEKYASEGDLEKIKEVYEKEGVGAAAREVMRQFPHVLAENIPQILASIVGGVAGTAAAGPVGGMVGAGMVSGAMQAGSNLERQVEAQAERGEAVDPSLMKAAGAGAVQAGLDVFALGKLGLGRFVGMAPKVAEKELLATAQRSLGATVGRGMVAGGTEIPTEIAQQVIERAQAGLPLASEDAWKEYQQAGYAAALLGPSIGGAMSPLNRASARDEVEANERQKNEEETAKQLEAEAARKADPAYAGSMEGLIEQHKALKAQQTALRQQQRGLNPKDPIDAERIADLQGQHKAITEQIKTLGERMRVAKLTPEQYMLEQATAAPFAKVSPTPEELDKRTYQGASPVEAMPEPKRRQKAAQPVAPEMFAPGVEIPPPRNGDVAVDVPDPTAFAPQYPTADAQDAYMLSLTDPKAYQMWLAQSQREREAGQLHGMGDAGQLPAPVEQMAPVIGPNGKVASYRPIQPGEGQPERPNFEFGVQLPGGVQQDLPLGEALPLRPMPVPAKQPRAVTSLGEQPAPVASAAPVPPAGVKALAEWRTAIPGQDVSPRPRENIPADGVAPAEGQQELPLETADALVRAAGASGPSSHLPRRVTSNKVASPTALVERAKLGKNDAYANLTMLLTDLRNNGSASRWKYDSPEGVEARNPYKAAARPEITAPLKRADLWNAVKRERAKFVAYALREIVEKRDQMGLVPLTRTEYNKVKEQIELLATELTLRSTNPAAKPSPTPKQRFVWNKGAIRSPEHAKRVQDAILRIRNEVWDLTRTLSRERHKYTDWVEAEQAVRTLEEREEALSEKLFNYFEGPNAQGKSVVRPWTGAKNDNSDLAMERPFGKLKAAREAIFEQIERVQDRALRTESGPKTTVKTPFELGKKYDYTPAPKEVTPEQEAAEFTTAALEAEVTGKQQTMFGDRGTGALTPELFRSYIKMFQARFAKQKKQLEQTVAEVKKYTANTADAGTAIAHHLSRYRKAKASMLRLAGLLNGDKYGPEIRNKVFALAEQADLWKEAEVTLDAEVVIEKRLPAFFTTQDDNAKNIAEAKARARQAAINAKKAEIALRPFADMKEKLDSLIEAYETALTEMRAAEAAIGVYDKEAYVGNFHIERLLKKAQEEMRAAGIEATQAIEKKVEEAKEIKRRFDLPLPKEEKPAPRPGRLIQPKSEADKKLWQKKPKRTKLDSFITSVAAEGYKENKGSPRLNEKARLNDAVLQKAFEEQTGQVGMAEDAIARAKERRRGASATEEDIADLRTGELGTEFLPDGFGGGFSDEVGIVKNAVAPTPAAQAVRATMTKAAQQAAKAVGMSEPFTEGVLDAAIPMQVSRELPPNTDTPNGATRIHAALNAFLQHGPQELRPLARLIKLLLPTKPNAFNLTVDPLGYGSTGHGGATYGRVSHYIEPAWISGKQKRGEIRLRYSPGVGGRGYISNEVFLHELLHVAIMSRFGSLAHMMDGSMPVSSPEMQKALDQFKALYSEFTEQMRPDGPLRKAFNKLFPNMDEGAGHLLSVSLDEALRDPEEFLIRALTDPAFQKALAQVRYKGQSMLERIKAWVKEVLGFGEDAPSWLDAALIASYDVAQGLRNEEVDLSAPDRAGAISYQRDEQAFSQRLATKNAVASAAAQSGVRKLYPERQSLRSSARKNFLGYGLRTQYFDRWAPVVGIANKMMDALKATQMVYFVRMADRTNQMTAEAMTNGPVELVELPRKDGRVERMFQSAKGVAVRDIVKTLKGQDFKLWSSWMALKRAQATGKGLAALLGDGAPTLTPEEQQAILAEGDALPAFEIARQQYAKYNASLVKLMVDTGAISEKDANDMLSRDYIPFYRVDPNGDVRVMGEHPIKIGNVRDQADLARLVGSDKPLDDPFQNIATNTRIIMKLALQNEAAKSVAFTLKDLGLAEINNSNLRGRVEQGRNVIHFKWKGVDRTAIVNTGADSKYADIPSDLLVKGMEGIATTLPDMFRVLQVPAQFLRNAITLMPTYMFRQLIRDPMHAWLSTGMDFSRAAKGLTRVRALANHRDETGNLLRERGLVGGQVIQGNDEDMGRIMAQLHAGEGVIQQFHAKLQEYATASDAATRAAMYDDFKAKGLSDMEATLAAMDAINFATRGLSPTVHALNMIIPFFNAQLQGIDSVYRALNGQMPFNDKMKARQKLIQRAMMVAAGTTLYYSLVQDEDWYKNTPENVRLSNWLFKIPGVDEPIRIPIPFEFGLLFKALPETIYIASKNDKEADAAWKALGNMAANQLPGGSSFLIPAGAKPLIEKAANHSFFTGRDIVPGSLQGEDAPDQWTLNTTESAKALSSIYGGSPMHFENLVRGYTGPAGYAVLQLMDAFIQPNTSAPPDKPLSRTAIVGPLFQQVDGSAVINRAYEQVKKIEAAAERYRRANEQGREADALDTLSESGDLIGYKSAAGRFKQEMGKLTKLERIIHFDPRLSSEEKAKQLSEIRQMKIERARQFEQLAP